MSAAARPLVQVRSVSDKPAEAKAAQLQVPAVFLAPIRPDIVGFVHTSMNKNKRQAYGVNYMSGMQHSAESWGTGRAVARIPRVSGGGNSRSGQGAFGNMCRKGRMFAPTKVWRKWHRKINTNQKRYAVASALAASALPSLVLARGHKVDQVPEIPLVVDNSVESVNKTKQAVAALKAVGAYADVVKAADSRKIRAGVGKSRNRRHVMRRGPLVVYDKDNGITQAFRNLPGVEVASVESLNLLQLAPGGHLGRFVIWTRGAFEKLNAIWGSTTRESTQKSGYTLPRSLMANSDLTRIINSDEVQSKLRPAKKGVKRYNKKRNPLKNLGALVKLNPHALALRRAEVSAQERRTAAKAKLLAAKRAATPTKEELKAAARARTHEPQQRLNFQRLSADDVKPAGPALKLKVQKPRAPQAPPAALTDEQRKKKSDSAKAKRAKKPKQEKKEKKEAAAEPKKLTKGQQVLAQLLKSQAMAKPAKKKSSGGGGGKGGKGKKDDKKDGKDAKGGDPKKEAGKKEAGKKEAAKEEAKKGGKK
jgi:large subunit ribosomal protein L4e